MQYRCYLSFALLFSSGVLAAAESAGSATQTFALTSQAGVPLRLYLTKRLPKRVGEPVHAKLAEPLFAVDRQVAPAGAEVSGTVARLDPVSKWRRASAILAGDFTPLHEAEVKFTNLMLPDGRSIALQTRESIGLNSIFLLHPPKPKKARKNPGNNTGVLGTGRQAARDQINARINARTQGLADIVRGPDKKERFTEFLLMKLPYHPQWVRKGTRFDAVLEQPLAFGTASVQTNTLNLLGSQPPADSVVHARLITALNSGTAKPGQAVEAIVSQPLFGPDNKLILPEGTHLSGAVTVARAARWLHRGGQLRFNFQKIDLPEGLRRTEIASERPAPMKTQATLEAAESNGRTAIKVDEEGGVKSVEPKTRFIAPALSVLIAAKSLDNDEGRVGRNDSNVGGRTLGGGSGLGLLGAAAAQSSRTLGSALGFYGMAWSVYTNIIARGGEVEFDDNAAMDIRFGGARVPGPAHKFKADAATAGLE